MTTRMYPDAKTWSPYKGCRWDCTYCRPTFQALSKRFAGACGACARYEPHEHPERLDPRRIPNAAIVFVAGNADLCFATAGYRARIIDTIKAANIRHPERTYYLQSKKPLCFQSHVRDLPDNVILVTTLETNRDAGYAAISKAPTPEVRWRQFRELDYGRKVITIEPMLAFDPELFAAWIADCAPEYVWLGYNSRPRQAPLPEPTESDVRKLVALLLDAGIHVRGKDLRGLTIEGVE